MSKTDRRVRRLTRDAEVAIAFANGVPGADRRVLERVAESVACGKDVPPELQKIANAVLCVALLNGKLPPKAAGRHRDVKFAFKQIELAYRSFEVLDKSGCTKAEADRIVADQLHVDPRHVERARHDYQWLIGWLKTDRSLFRAWRSHVSDEEYREALLLDLRLHEGLQPAGQPSLKERLASAPSLLAAMRKSRLQILAGERVDSSQTGSSATVEVT